MAKPAAAASPAPPTALASSAAPAALASYDGSTASDSDGEMCTFVESEQGLQMVCSDDPTPVSVAEMAALHPVIKPTLLQDIEARLEADVSTVLITIVFAVGVIMVEFGVQSLLDHYLGESIVGMIGCIVGGLSVVLYFKIAGYRIARFWSSS